MYGLIPRKVRLEMDAGVELVEEAFSHSQVGVDVRLNGRRFKIVHQPGLEQAVSVFEGSLLESEKGCVFDGRIRWSLPTQLLLAVMLAFLLAFSFGIPVLMIRSFLMGTTTYSVIHPLVLALFWALLTWLPFHFLFKFIFKSRLPEIEKHLRRIILGVQTSSSTGV